MHRLGRRAYPKASISATESVTARQTLTPINASAAAPVHPPNHSKILRGA
jgi:hypothetical protein